MSTNRLGTNWDISITDDIASVPGTTNVPIAVNTINGGCVSDANGSLDLPVNPRFYVDNHDPYYSSIPPYDISAPVFNTQYDGATVRLTAQADVRSNIVHHIKIAIADYSDAIYDSAVFMRYSTPCQ